METFKEILNWAGYIGTIIFVIGVLWAIGLWLKGILPVLIRLGNGLAKRKIAIFDTKTSSTDLKALLSDSKLFSPNNIREIPTENEISQGEEIDLILVHWAEWREHYTKILDLVKDKTALIIYAPQEEGIIHQDVLKQINIKCRHFVLCNMRGRLLNDILVSMMTTGK